MGRSRRGGQTLGLLRAGSAVLRHPGLWPTAVRAAIDLAPDRWWRRPPFLPLPDRAWLRFRLVTAYGGDGTGSAGDGTASGGPDPDDLVAWLMWRRDWAPGRG